MRVVVLGGDGFCGWPSALHLSASGHDVTIVDDFVRRRADDELGVQSLAPIRSLAERVDAWHEVSGREIAVVELDVAHDYDVMTELLIDLCPDALVHFAEQRSAPYSMKSPPHKRYTIDNNLNATHTCWPRLSRPASTFMSSTWGPWGCTATRPSRWTCPRGISRSPGRRQVLRVGGMVQGINGEDADICMRLAAAGFHNVADPKAVYYSETPASYAHLREQRTRWFRSIYHLAARNRAVLLDRRTMIGTFVLPFNLVNAARRAMLAPLLIYAAIAGFAFHTTFTSLRWQPIVATLLGMSMIMTVIVCLIWRPDSVKYIPAYLCFRLLRSYFTLAAVLTFVYPPMYPRIPGNLRLFRRRHRAEPSLTRRG